MTKKELMIKAHKMVKEIKNEYPTVDYKFQLGLCLAYLNKEGEKEMVELKGTEKQVAWAEKIREDFLKALTVINFYKKDELIIKGKYSSYAIEKLENFKNEIENNSNSVWFIENRETICDYGTGNIFGIKKLIFNTDDNLLKLEDKRVYKTISQMYKRVEKEYIKQYKK